MVYTEYNNKILSLSDLKDIAPGKQVALKDFDPKTCKGIVITLCDYDDYEKELLRLIENKITVSWFYTTPEKSINI